MEFRQKMGKWPADRQKKTVKFFNIHNNVFTVGLKEWMPVMTGM